MGTSLLSAKGVRHDGGRAGGEIGTLGEVALMRLVPKPTRLTYVGMQRKGDGYMGVKPSYARISK